ncbi:MAG: ABC transporter permease [Actinomycetota bacterium]|nr:ABC transporter permease [Actinomycetota bacterium]
MTQALIPLPDTAPAAVPDVAPNEATKVIQGRSPWQLAFERLRHDKVAVVSIVTIVIIIAMAFVAPLVAHLVGHGPNVQFRETGLSPEGIPVGPSSHFLLGTDELGRDILVRIFYGARVSLLAGVFASTLAVALGVVIGLVAGYFGGSIDGVLSRFMDVVLSLPYLVFAIALISVVGPSLGVSIIVIAFFSFASVGRIVRGQVLSITTKEFVEAARSLGASDARIMFVDILPNVLAPVIVYMTLLIPLSIVFEASLSFLGLGVLPPTASWGGMLAQATDGGMYQVAWWFLVFPGAALLVTTLAFNLLGDSVRDAFDPRYNRLFAV